MKARTPAIAEITNLSHEGRGVAKINGKTHFIANALPDETVTFEFLRKKAQFVEGVATEIIQPSKLRVQPKCPYFVRCGGCSMQHLSSDDQIAHKQKTLLEHIDHIGKTTPEEILDPLRGPIWNYRNRARLSVKYVHAKQSVLVGFRERNGRYVMDMQHCEILHESIAEHINDLRNLIAALSCPDKIPQIEVAVGERQTVLIIRHLESLNNDDIQLLKEFALKYAFTIYLQPNKQSSIHLLGSDESVSYLQYHLNQDDLNMEFLPTDFTQVNPHMNNNMVEHALNLLDPKDNENVLDLFCGLGNFTLPIAKRAKYVVGIEGSEDMVKRVYHNATLNDIKNVQCYAQDLTQDFSQAEWAQQTYDKILLDPPRSGAQELLPFLAKQKPKRIVYISCNPSTLARDAGILVNEYQYKLKKCGIMDMFPHTSHVESIAVFERL